MDSRSSMRLGAAHLRFVKELRRHLLNIVQKYQVELLSKKWRQKMRFIKDYKKVITLEWTRR